MGCRLSGPWLGDGMGVNTHDLSHIRNREALRILASYEQPITLQIEGRRGRSLQFHRTSDCSTQTERPWDPLHTLTITHAPYSDRPYYSHMTLPGNHGNGGRYDYLPNTPRDLQDRHNAPCHDYKLSNRGPQGQSCLIGCCNTNLEEPSSFQSQTEDEDYMLEKSMGYLPLHHELDSGLGWTDGSFHQGELSGVETEEGLEECHAHRGGGEGGSPSSESFISSELSDSGFYSVSTGEFLRFQRLLEKRMRLYNTRMHHQGDLRENQKGHRELEAIPEALMVQPNVCVPGGMGGHPRGLFRVSSVQFRKAERPSLNRHSSSSGALFTPHPAISACSTPSSQKRLPPHHSASTGMLRRSRTLHHRPPQVEHRRRASHPASPNYCMTLHSYSHRIQTELPEKSELLLPHLANLTAHHANQATQHANHTPHPMEYATHHSSQATHHANHQSHPPEYAAHHANHQTHPAEYATQATHHANQTTHHANHQTISADYATFHANNGTHAKYTAHHPNLTLPAHATLPANHAHLAQRPRPKHAISQPSLTSSFEDSHCDLPLLSHEPHHHDNGCRSPGAIWEGRNFASEFPAGREREGRFHTLSHTPSQEVNDTWPKPASRQSLGGLYSTLEGHTTTMSPTSSRKPGSGPATNPRAVRNQMLRDRALRLADERSGMSTDEESHCEIRTGRYWSRTERREHVLQKRAQRGGCGVSTATAGGTNTVLELSQRKLSRLRNQKLLDDWTTVEELLTHGTRLGARDDSLQIPSSLLTVTTV
ncbi:uncharacterized protein [Hoplias malabaricus]|uniref:uncharacterized protein n=1 Tax=Hoplias malabaricus TaxID=27720 RepID=UPI0034622ACB